MHLINYSFCLANQYFLYDYYVVNSDKLFCLIISSLSLNFEAIKTDSNLNMVW